MNRSNASLEIHVKQLQFCVERQKKNGPLVVVELLMSYRFFCFKNGGTGSDKSHRYLPAVRLYKMMLRIQNNS